MQRQDQTARVTPGRGVAGLLMPEQLAALENIALLFPLAHAKLPVNYCGQALFYPVYRVHELGFKVCECAQRRLHSLAPLHLKQQQCLVGARLGKERSRGSCSNLRLALVRAAR